MGQSCCGRPAKYGAFKSDLGAPLMSDIVKKLPPSTKVAIVRLVNLQDIPIGNSYAGTSDPYCEISCSPNDPVIGVQKQTSAVKPGTLNPVWAPPERYQFVLSKPENTRVLFSIYHFNAANPADSLPMGDGVLKVKDVLAHTDLANPMIIKLKSPKDGTAAGLVSITVQVITLAEASSVIEQVIYEFERWQPVILWGHTPTPGHFLPTDPGRWSTEDGKRFGRELEEVAPPLEAGWTVTNSWHTIGTDFDPEGWQYSSAIESPFWHGKNDGATFYVRRRQWHRELRRDETSTHSPISSDAGGGGRAVSTSSTGSASGRRRRMFSDKAAS